MLQCQVGPLYGKLGIFQLFFDKFSTFLSSSPVNGLVGRQHFQLQMLLPRHELPWLRNLLVHNAAFDGHQRVVDSDEVVLAVLFQIHRIEVKFDDVAGVCPQPPLHEGVGGVGMVGEARRLDLSDVVGPGMLGKLKISWNRINKWLNQNTVQRQ